MLLPDLTELKDNPQFGMWERYDLLKQQLDDMNLTHDKYNEYLLCIVKYVGI